MVLHGLMGRCLYYGHMNALKKARDELAKATEEELKVAAKRPTLAQYIREVIGWDEPDIHRKYKRYVAKTASKNPEVLTDQFFFLRSDSSKSVGEAARELLEGLK